MGKTLFYLITLIAVIAVVVYLNIVKPLDKDLVTPAEQGVTSRISEKISSALSNNSKEVAIVKAESTQTAKVAEQASSDEAKTTDKVTPTETKADEKSPPLVEAAAQPLDNAEPASTDDGSAQALPAREPTQSSSNQTSAIRVLLIPDSETTIASTITGRITGIKSNLGQRFNKGAVLVAFDCNQAYARVEIAKAELAGAIEEHEAKVKMQGLDQASDVEVALAASASNKAKAELKLNRTMVSECKIYAPWKGRVSKAHARKSMTVNAGEPLLEIVNTGPLKLKLNIPSKLLSEIKIGAKFDVIIDETGQNYSATIKAINSRIDPVSQTVEIEAKMDKAHAELLAGMSGTADFTGLGIYQ